MQHKQIRPNDPQHQDDSQGFYGGVGGGGGGNFQRGGYGSHLPPSGAMAAHNMGSSSPWLAAPQGGDGAGGGQPGINPDNNASTTPGLDGAADSSGVGMGTSDGALSPLANLDPLLNALPDVPGNE